MSKIKSVGRFVPWDFLSVGHILLFGLGVQYYNFKLLSLGWVLFLG